MNSNIKIYMADLVHNYTQGNYVVPLNIASIAAYLKATPGIDANIKLFKYPADLMNAFDKEKPDILAFSNYFWNNDLNRQVGRYVCKHYPDVIISMGGPSIRIDPIGIKKFLENNNFIDAYILSEGENPFVSLVKRIMEDKKGFKDGKDIEGYAYLAKGELIYKTSDPIQDLSTLPSPYLAGLLDEFLYKGLVPLFESNRGCPFSCTFCTWGISALHKVRVFPTKRIFAELEFVSKNFPDIPVWIFADANFGIFSRDIQIAEKIREIKKKTPQLKRVVFWQTKNASKQNLKLANTIGDLENYLIAVQTFDPIVQGLIKRKNIRCDDVSFIVQKLKHSRVKTSTDILCGLPGETKESHLNTLRKCFDIGFEFIDCGNVLMLPGSELETEESRHNFKLITKYRLREGSYGEYKGIKAMESEEIIRASASMSENDMLKIRLIHWMIWYGWNAGFLKCAIKYLHQEYKINPVDLIIYIINSKDGFLNKFFNDFVTESKNEWFESEEALRQYYNKAENWDCLLRDHFSKMNFKYTALLILDNEVFIKFLNSICNALVELTSSRILPDVMHIIKNKTISPDAIFCGNVIRKKNFKVKKECLRILLEEDKFEEMDKRGSDYCDIVLDINPEDIITIKNTLIKHDFGRNKNIAVEKTLEIFLDNFSYTIKSL